MSISKSLPQSFKTAFSMNFTKCTKGYHLLNSDPIKETLWENINAQIFKASNCEIHQKSQGSHLSGKDLSSEIGNFSNKSCKYRAAKNKAFDISSYRMTNICSATHHGTPDEIIAEIQRRKNFDYYSIIVRKDPPRPRSPSVASRSTSLPHRPLSLTYDWYVIPADHPLLSPQTYDWKPLLGQKGSKKGTIIGWETNTIEGSKMKITYTMSSQLWITLKITDEIEDLYKIATSTIPEQPPEMDYIKLFDQLTLEEPQKTSPPKTRSLKKE